MVKELKVMVKVARITAIALMVIGVMVVLVGFGLGIGSMFMLGVRQAFRGVGPGMQMVRFGGGGVGLAVIAVAFIQGLLMVAWGEGLYLLSKLVQHMPKPATVIQPNPEPAPVTPE
jgi:hypothetical protein